MFLNFSYYFLTYSRVRNKHRGALIKFGGIFRVCSLIKLGHVYQILDSFHRLGMKILKFFFCFFFNMILHILYFGLGSVGKYKFTYMIMFIKRFAKFLSYSCN